MSESWLRRLCYLEKLVDIRLVDGKIAGINELPDRPGPKDFVVIPGMIDPHVHSRQPGGDQKEDWPHLWQAAAKGGVTTIVTMPNTDPAIISYEVLEQARELAKESAIRPLFWFGATSTNHDQIRRALSDPDVVGIKMFMGSSTGDLLISEPRQQKRIFGLGAEIGCPVAVHAEDEEIIKGNLEFLPHQFSEHGQIRSGSAEMRAVSQAIAMAMNERCRLYICHASCPQTVEFARFVKTWVYKDIFLEASPHHLFLNCQVNPGSGFFKMNPPLRSYEEMRELRGWLSAGWIDTIGSDHAPHTKEEKSQRDYDKCPSGVPGIETSLPLLIDQVLEGQLTWSQLAELTAEAPARAIGLRNKGRLQVGFDADLVILDPSKETEVKAIKSKCGWSPFEGKRLKGRIVKTIAGGLVLYSNEE